MKLRKFLDACGIIMAASGLTIAISAIAEHGPDFYLKGSFAMLTLLCAIKIMELGSRAGRK